MSQYSEWSSEECSKVVRRDALLEEHIVEQYIDSIKKQGQTFSLYYFVKDLTFDNREKPTILFAAGGPGQMVLASSGENFVDLLGYRVVYFHLRGTGFSQLPKDISWDQYLRTDYVVRDVEAIRRDYLGDTRWKAVIGHSYGAVVAQWYAHDYPESVEKIVLSAPILPVSVLDQNQLAPVSSGKPKPLNSLRRIYEGDDFAFLNDIGVGNNSLSTKEYIVSQAEDVLEKVERSYWNVQYIADEYEDLERQLEEEDLDLGAPFFSAVRKLRLCGWLALDVPLARGGDIEVDTAQLESGLMIAAAILEKFASANLREEVKKEMINASGQKNLGLKKILVALDSSNRASAVKTSQNTARAYYVISLYDGLNEKFLKELKSDSDVKKGIESIVNRHSSNRFLEKAGSELTNAPEPWDPAKKKHGSPTLILKGGADPLNESGEAQYYFDHGLTGDRALVEFPGVGHSMALPYPLLNSGAGINAITIERDGKSNEESFGTREALIHAFLANTYVEFKQTRILTEIDAAFEDALSGFEKSRPWNKKFGSFLKLEKDRLIKQFCPE